MMDRRAFLKRFTAAAAIGTAAVVAGVEFDPERLLWVPGAKSFFLPPERRLVAGAEAVQAFDQIQNFSGLREQWTSSGTGVFDVDWNLIAIRGRRVTAREAAGYRLSNYGSYRGVGEGRDIATETELVVAQRIAAGWADPYGRYNGDISKARYQIGTAWKE